MPRCRRCSPASTPTLLQPPMNVLRLSLHPEGLAPRIANLAEWRAHLLARLRQQIDVTADPRLIKLSTSLRLSGARRREAPRVNVSEDYAGVVVPLRFKTDAGPVVVLDHDDFRHAGRHHAVGAGDRVVLSGRCRDRRHAARRRMTAGL